MILKVIFANSVDPHCLPVCKNRFEKFARIFSRRHKQMTFLDAGFLGVLRVNCKMVLEFYFLLLFHTPFNCGSPSYSIFTSDFDNLALPASEIDTYSQQEEVVLPGQDRQLF